MAMKKTRYIGNKQFESECIKCGEVMLWQKGDDIFVDIDAAGDTGLLCSRCYDGPRMPREELEKRERERGEK
jgi:hypothetical protein